MESYRFLLDLALILLTTKIFGLITRRLQLPQVVGALLAGLVFGPGVLGIVQPSDFLSSLSEIGVIVIMFSAGMTTDIRELKNAGKSGFLVALIGVLVPLGMGTALGFLFAPGESGPGALLQHVFIGTILTATSVSITVEALKELGKLNTKVGNTILAAALIDDVLGLIVLTVVTSLAGDDVNILIVLLKILLFFVFVAVVAFVGIKGFTWYENRYKKNLHRFPLLAFVLCLGMAYIAERVFGVADIIGAFAAGVIIANTPPGGVHRLEIPAAVVPAADAGIFRQHRAEGVAALHDLADRGVRPAAGGDGHPLETGGLRPGGQGVRLRLEGELAGGPGHGLPGRGGADRGQQGGCHRADA